MARVTNDIINERTDFSKVSLRRAMDWYFSPACGEIYKSYKLLPLRGFSLEHE